MSNEQIDELLALEAKATPGPWEQEVEDGDATKFILFDGDIICNAYDGPHDSAFIAAARNNIRELAEEVKRLRAEQQELSTKLRRLKDAVWEVLGK